jgi:hypothetical protein
MSRISIAALLVVVLVASVRAPVAGQAADDSGRFVVPDVADLTLETRRVLDRPGATVVTRTLKLKGAWQRSEETLSLPRRRGGEPSTRTHVLITRCDERRTIQLNDEARTYASMPIEDAAARVQRLRETGAVAPRPMAPGAEVKVIIDAVDTGERRQVGRLTARHVITTTTTEPGAGARTPASKGVVDGWYLDLPPINCWEWGERAPLAFGSIAPDRVRYERRGMAKRGVPIEEEARSSSGGRDNPATKTEFVRVSEAPLDKSLFAAPKSYQPALPNLNGGFDMTKPDTLANRIESYWESLASWARYMMRD